MSILFIVLIILASVVLGLIVLIQNPKGGGLAGNIAGFSNQFMGVKQTNDVLERGTWIFAAIIAVLCLTASIFLGGKSATQNIEIAAPTNQAPNTNQLPPINPGATTPAATTPGTATQDSTK
jgi:preprotein translocase subunit SecG